MRGDAAHPQKARAVIARPAVEFVRQVFIGLGSNLGAREEWLARALAHLLQDETMRLIQQSSLYETEPVGVKNQPGFLNQVVEIAAALTPQELLEKLLETERRLGRVRELRWGPRNIDLDLLAFHRIDMQTETLTVPHPESVRRRFVLAPWCELAPDFLVPGFNASVAALLARCEDHSRVIKRQKV